MKTVPDTLTNERVAVFVDYHNTLSRRRPLQANNAAGYSGGAAGYSG